jgi:hypothetical protein
MSHCTTPSTYWHDRIATVQALIAAYDTALNALIVRGAFSYSLDTGQSRQTVTKHNIVSMQNARSSLLNELATLEARVCGAGVHVVPSW